MICYKNMLYYSMLHITYHITSAPAVLGPLARGGERLAEPVRLALAVLPGRSLRGWDRKREGMVG